MAAGVDIRVVHTVVETAGSTQDITVSGFGTPKGALFFWDHATADGTLINHCHLGMGATDFTREWACSYFSEHNVEQSNCTHFGSNDKCIQFSNTSGNGVETNMEADASTITDGLRLTWTGTPGTARRFTVVMFTGDDCHVEAGTFLNDAQLVDSARAITLTDMTVRPEVVFVGHMVNAFSGTVTADSAISMGMGADHAGTIDQANLSWNDQDNRNPANRHGQNVESTHIGSTPPFTGSTLLTAWELTQTGVNGTPRGTFQLTKRITSATSSFGYFCYSSDGNNAYDVDLPSLDHVTTGVKNYTAFGFQPQFALLFPSNVNATGITVTAPAAGSGVSAIDEDTLGEGCLHTQSDEVDPSDTSSWFKSQFLSVRNDVGGQSYNTDFTAFTATGFNYTPVNTSSNTKPTPVCCIEIDTGAGLVEIIDDVEQVEEDAQPHLSMARLVDETVQLVESTVRPRVMARLADEVVQIVESTVRPRIMARQVDEVVQIIEATEQHRAILQLVDETVNILESTEQHRAVVQLVNEVVQIVESTLRPRVMVRLVDEVVQIVEVAEQHRAITQLVDETVNISETTADALATALVEVIDEVIQIAESTEQHRAILQLVDEVVQIVESTVRPRVMARQVDEVVQIVEATEQHRAILQLVDEVVQIVESTVDALAAAGAALVEIVDEVVQIVEATEQHRAIAQFADEAVQVVEAINTARTMARVISEVMQIEDEALRSIVLVRVLSEVVEISDQALSARALTRIIDELVQILEGTVTKIVIGGGTPGPIVNVDVSLADLNHDVVLATLNHDISLPAVNMTVNS